MYSNEIQQEALILFLLSIYIFEEFEVRENCVSLKITQKKNIKNDDQLIKEIIRRLISALNIITGNEFYFTYDNDLKKLSLHCHSKPNFFSEICAKMT